MGLRSGLTHKMSAPTKSSPILMSSRASHRYSNALSSSHSRSRSNFNELTPGKIIFTLIRWRISQEIQACQACIITKMKCPQESVVTAPEQVMRKEFLSLMITSTEIRLTPKNRCSTRRKSCPSLRSVLHHRFFRMIQSKMTFSSS